MNTRGCRAKSRIADPNLHFFIATTILRGSGQRQFSRKVCGTDHKSQIQFESRRWKLGKRKRCCMKRLFRCLFTGDFTTTNPSFQMPSARHSGYRDDIDGLRAVAVVMVLGFHAFPEYVPGGFVGVDVFFVVSGYLISGIIISDLANGRFCFLEFYARRIRRIFPAVILVLAGISAAGWFLLLPDEFENLGKHVLGGAAFVSNFVLIREAGYFDSETTLKPLLHLWSLGVEEQFYILWPAALFVAWKWKYGAVGATLLLFIGSFWFNLTLVWDHATAAYFLPFTRFWELMLGCGLAYLLSRPSGAEWFADLWKSTKWLPSTLAAFSLCTILMSAGTLDPDSGFPGWWALFPTVSALVLVLVGMYSWPNRAILANRLFSFVGRISFPLYLWHWPLLSLLFILKSDPPSTLERSVALLLSGLLSWLTYLYVEKPIRSRNATRVSPWLGAAMVGVGSVGAAVHIASGVPGRMNEKAEYSAFFGNLAYTKSQGLMEVDRHECNFYDIQTHEIKQTIHTSCFVPLSSQAVLLWGDSHVQHLNYGLRHALRNDVSLLQVSSSGCSPAVRDRDEDALDTCNRANRFAIETIERVKPDVVILAQQGGHDKTDFDELATLLKRAGVRKTILIGPVPQWQPFLFKLVLKDYWGKLPIRLADHRVQSVIDTDRVLEERYRDSFLLTYISLVQGLCTSEGCLTHLDGNPKDGLITYDYGHFTLPASDYVVKNFVAPEIAEFLKDRETTVLSTSPR